jgi:hypothetical protein
LYAHVFDRKRAHATTKAKMSTWMDTYEQAIAKYKPVQIWSADESQLCGKGSDDKTKRRKVIGVRTKPAKILRTMFSEHVTLMAAISAAGLTLPPFLIFTGKVSQIISI